MSSRIVHIQQQVVEVRLNQPFTIAGGSQGQAQLVVVRMTLEDGTVGLGEAAPLPAYNGETLADVSRAIDSARPRLLGQDATRWRHLAAEVAAVARHSGAARCAIETALLDALARRSGLSLWQWFGGAAEPALEIDVTIPIDSVEVAERAAREWWARGFRSLKIKVGAAEDVARVLAVVAAAPEAKLLLDANAGLSAEQAVALLSDVRQQGAQVALFEQPVARGDWTGLRQVRECGVRIALDESVVGASDVLDAARELGSDVVVNVKLMKAGLVAALDVVSAARAAGMGLMIGGMVESTLAMTTSACFALGLAGFEFADLDTHLFLVDSPFRGGLQLNGAQLSVAGVTAGHGVSLVE
jgi:L-Ala-D/L-Glu epimerase